MSSYASYSRRDRRRPAEEAVAESSAHARKRQAREREEAEETVDQPDPNGADANGDDEDGDEEEIDLSLLPAEGMMETDKAKRAAEAMGSDVISQKAIELVRFALACEYSKTPIRKDVVSKKVLNGRQASTAFPVIFNKAQKMLRTTFGYALIELRAVGTENQQLVKQSESAAAAAEAATQGPESSNRSRAAEKGKQSQKEDGAKPGSTATRSWVLHSVLPTQLIGRLAVGNDELVQAGGERDEITAAGADETGTVLDWKKADQQLGSIGLLYVILSLILLNGRAISQAQLLSYLRRLRLQPEERLPSRVRLDGVHSGGGGETQTQSHTQRGRHRRGDAGDSSLDEYLYQLRKQHYLERVRTDVVPNATGATQATQRHAGGSRMRDDEEGASYEWRWGSRAEVEVSETDIARMIEVLFHQDEEEEEAAAAAAAAADGADGAPAARSRRARRRESLLKDIEAAAGSQLISF